MSDGMCYLPCGQSVNRNNNYQPDHVSDPADLLPGRVFAIMHPWIFHLKELKRGKRNSAPRAAE